MIYCSRDGSWYPATAGYAGRDVVARCGLDGHLQCSCVASPAMQLAAARAIIEADRERAVRSRERMAAQREAVQW